MTAPPSEFLYFTFNAPIVSNNASVTALATMIGAAHSSTPYASHRTTPAENVISIPQERSWQRLLRHALCTCGTNESVVNVPAINPSSAVKCIGSNPSVVHFSLRSYSLFARHLHCALQSTKARGKLPLASHLAIAALTLTSS